LKQAGSRHAQTIKTEIKSKQGHILKRTYKPSVIILLMARLSENKPQTTET